VSIAGLAYLSLLQSWHPRVTNTWNTPGWSLSTEAFFYATFPLLLVGTLRSPLRLLFGVAIVACALPMLGYFLLTHWRLVHFRSAELSDVLAQLPSASFARVCYRRRDGPVAAHGTVGGSHDGAPLVGSSGDAAHPVALGVPGRSKWRGGNGCASTDVCGLNFGARFGLTPDPQLAN
jgi:peptidoglycan/LPS O-acetylase OafA/YrhL